MKSFFTYISTPLHLLQKKSSGLRSLLRSAKSAPKGRVYLDNAGATEVGVCALHALLEALNTYGNPSGIHHEGADASQLLDTARARCATELNAHAYEVYFVGSGTESCNLAVLGVYEGYKRQTTEERGQTIPHIITSAIEHPAVLEPVKWLEKNGKVSVTYLPVYTNGIVKVHDLREALRDETILVSVMYANNEIGTLQPVKEIGRAIDEWKREQGRTFTAYPYFHTDACQAANYCNLDVLRLKCHLMTVNSSKIYGPKGIALLYKREGIRVSPSSYGGGQERELRSGTENVAGAYAFSGALKEACDMREEEHARMRVLQSETVEMMKQEIPGIIFYGAFDTTLPEGFLSLHEATKGRDTRRVTKEMKRLPNNINCRVPGISSEEMILRLDAHGFAVSHKSACASMETDGSYVIQALGASTQEALENIRISMGRSTTKSDMEKLVMVMKEISVKYSL